MVKRITYFLKTGYRLPCLTPVVINKFSASASYVEVSYMPELDSVRIETHVNLHEYYMIES